MGYRGATSIRIIGIDTPETVSPSTPEPGYDPCVPVYPPDVDCADVDGPIAVTGSDPHGLDGEGDGIACEALLSLWADRGADPKLSVSRWRL